MPDGKWYRNWEPEEVGPGEIQVHAVPWYEKNDHSRRLTGISLVHSAGEGNHLGLGPARQCGSRIVSLPGKEQTVRGFSGVPESDSRWSMSPAGSAMAGA
jgi:hypothetical protein